MTVPSRKTEGSFWRKVVLCEEDRRSLSPEVAPIVSAHRWFRSENVIDLLRYRKRKQAAIAKRMDVA
jgi:hypothetical protein